MSNYHIYGREDCEHCDSAASLLSDNNLDWVMEYLNEDAAHLTTLLGQANLTTVPQIYGPDGQYIGGLTQLQAHLNPVPETPSE